MLSRVELKEQLIILDKLYAEKWKVSKEALEAVEDMERNALNLNTFFSPDSFNIISMNIRSFSNFHHFVADQSIYGAQMILLQETWQRPEDLSNSIDGFINSFNSGLVARGNGIASYYKDYDIEIESAWDTSYQITKLSTAK